MNQPLLSFEAIEFSYRPGEKVLHGLNLDIQAGAVTTILGPNGAGKTTLLHLALGWLPPRAGQIYLAQRPLESYSRRELGRWIGLVPQSEYISFEYSLLEYVLLGRAPYLNPLEMPRPQDFEAALSALERVGLGELWQRPLSNLSGGERQLVLLARALAQQPRLLLLDEPTSHLDLANKKRLTDLLRGLSAQGATILLTTHEPEVAAAVSSHLVLMRAGQVLHAGALAETLTSQYLSETYGVAVRVDELAGQRVVLWR